MYLALARSVVTEYERNEKDEKRSALLSPEDTEALKARIIAAVMVDPSEFDRAEYERLTALWKAHEAAEGPA